MSMHKRYVSIFLVLVVIYIFYNKRIYTAKSDYGNFVLSEEALKGEKLWLENNCNACHQLYGLGGYLGPDLTNVCSVPGKSDAYLKAMMVSGVKSMPEYKFSSLEQDRLLQFLKEVDKTGYYPNRKAKIEYSGWVRYQQKENDEK